MKENNRKNELIAGLLFVGGVFLFKEPSKYSRRWFRTLSDVDLDAEREIVRKLFVSAGNDDKLNRLTSSMLELFDNEMRRRINIAYKKNPPPVKPGFRWTDANRWE